MCQETILSDIGSGLFIMHQMDNLHKNENASAVLSFDWTYPIIFGWGDKLFVLGFRGRIFHLTMYPAELDTHTHRVNKIHLIHDILTWQLYLTPLYKQLIQWECSLFDKHASVAINKSHYQSTPLYNSVINYVPLKGKAMIANLRGCGLLLALLFTNKCNWSAKKKVTDLYTKQM